MMGAHLEAAYGAAYLPIEFSFHRGSFQAYSGGLVEHTVGPAPTGSMDDTFHRAGWPIFVLDLRQLPRGGAVAAWFAKPQPRWEGGALVPASDEDMVLTLPLAAESEAVIFVESTTRARPNPNSVRRHVRPQPGRD
jgi:erythromycin esterase